MMTAALIADLKVHRQEHFESFVPARIPLNTQGSPRDIKVDS
uniref:Uncharacterized protein n=1 Tax=Arundo donax TaxID=35708 RepID=A0A0A9CEA0_ARUDO